MHKMSESQQSGPCGGKDRDMAQIYQHLRSKDPTELTDEKAPLSFEADPQEALSAFLHRQCVLSGNSVR